MPLNAARRRVTRLLFLSLVFVVLLAFVGAAGVVFAWTRFAQALPELQGWHSRAPASEFRAEDAKPGYTFSDYLRQEEQVFAELDTLIKQDWSPKVAGRFSRYKVDSVCNPDNILDRNWNRTFVSEAKNPVGGALLIHGLSDAPYSLRALAEKLVATGYTVVCLRVPGHGTSPKALAQSSWLDWAAATKLAMADLRKRIPAQLPVIAVGYSNGGALCVNDVCEGLLRGDASARPSALVLVSPMIGITPMAEFTELYPVVSWLTGEKKLSWSGVEPEIDPFKYSSWPVNASLQAFRITRHVEASIATLASDGRMKDFPPTLVVQSAADATVIAYRMIDILMDRLPPGRGELILFDINHSSWLDGLTNDSFEKHIRPRLKRSDLSFILKLVTNRATDSPDLVVRTLDKGAITEEQLDLPWPAGIFSLSHVAVPIPPNDPAYGSGQTESTRKLPLGTLALRGERGILAISSGLMMRMRFNPFYDWTEQQVLNWIASNTGSSNKGSTSTASSGVHVPAK